MQFVQKAQFILENLHFSSIFTRTWLPWRYVRFGYMLSQIRLSVLWKL